MKPHFIQRSDLKGTIDWPYFVKALAKGHKFPTPEIQDSFLGSPERTMLSRSAWIEGLGIGVKSVTYMSDNKAKGLPSVQGVMALFEDNTGGVKAIIDGQLITDIKTAADSVYAASFLAPENAKRHLVLGAGNVASNIIRAYRDCIPSIEETLVWNANPESANRLHQVMALEGIDIQIVSDLERAASGAEIITTATASSTPILKGAWLVARTHVDLIGAFRKEMREADDDVLRKGKIFVDSRDSTIDHIGELLIPIRNKVIDRSDVRADLYELTSGSNGRENDEDITVFKNGGGAHLDLMIADAILNSIENINS